MAQKYHDRFRNQVFESQDVSQNLKISHGVLQEYQINLNAVGLPYVKKEISNISYRQWLRGCALIKTDEIYKQVKIHELLFKPEKYFKKDDNGFCYTSMIGPMNFRKVDFREAVSNMMKTDVDFRDMHKM